MPALANGTSITPASKRERFHDLDALRGFLMIWGIVVHASTLAPSLIFDSAARVSGFVRMEAFFIISGLITGLLLQRYGAATLCRKRLITLGVPLAFGLVLLNPITNALVFAYHNPALRLPIGPLADAPPPPIVWHLHLWFLIPLMVYTLLAPGIANAILSISRARPSRFPQMSPSTTLTVVAGGVAAASLTGRVFYEFAIEPFFPIGLHFTLRSSCFYLPFFVLGLILYQHSGILNRFSRVHWLHLGAGVIWVAGSTRFFSSLPKHFAEASQLMAEAFLGTVMSAALFCLASRWFSRPRTWVMAVASASYSIYLFHFLVIYILALALRPLAGYGDLLIVLVIPATFVVTLALHHGLITRNHLLELLCNGRTWIRPRNTQSSPRLLVGTAGDGSV